MKSASAVSCSSCSYCDAIRVKGTPYPLFHVWELAVSFLGLPPLPLVPREDTKSQANSPNGRTIWIADTHRDGKRFIVHADEKLTAFLELESAIHACGELV